MGVRSWQFRGQGEAALEVWSLFGYPEAALSVGGEVHHNEGVGLAEEVHTGSGDPPEGWLQPS